MLCTLGSSKKAPPPSFSLFPYTTLFRSAPMTAADLAVAVGTQPDALGRVLRLLAAHGVFESDRKSTRLNSSHLVNSYAVFCLKKKTETEYTRGTSCYKLSIR